MFDELAGRSVASSHDEGTQRFAAGRSVVGTISLGQTLPRCGGATLER